MFYWDRGYIEYRCTECPKRFDSNELNAISNVYNEDVLKKSKNSCIGFPIYISEETGEATDDESYFYAYDIEYKTVYACEFICPHCIAKKTGDILTLNKVLENYSKADKG